MGMMPASGLAARGWAQAEAVRGADAMMPRDARRLCSASSMGNTSADPRTVIGPGGDVQARRSAFGLGLVQRYRSAHKRFQRLFIDLFALAKVDGAPGIV